MAASETMRKTPLFGGGIVAGAKWHLCTPASGIKQNRSPLVVHCDPTEIKALSRSAKKDDVRQLRSVLDMGLSDGRGEMEIRSAYVKICRSYARLIDPSVALARPPEKKKAEMVLAYDVHITGTNSSDAQKSVSVLAACIRALARGRANAGGPHSSPARRSVIVIHADGSAATGGAALSASTIKYIYKEFVGNTKGPNLAAVYVITTSAATQAIIGFTSMIMKGLEKVHACGSRNSVLGPIRRAPAPSEKK